MKMKPEEVAYIAKLAKLDLSEEEVEQYSREFDNILEHFEVIANFTVEDTKEDIFQHQPSTILRKDEPSLFEDQKKLYQNTKDLKDGLIRVPKILD
ncbi:Asp-tRNA(Asn)/Glu-tRNA(Gln) amidotransferase subunit GatC [Tindallia californiensis]|uniref:Aspartyl/glutamyl-tRNA(Asn/Gln) amidotransferase subunit C n=1 Tax=Tindallia californiensis TaxID=159292 RepID=A0A1H3L2P4_9FIRM|nr:Asp-tRNA(Asn)/Glu-tRNA(Gln) amidotransferase subunit GatC [Tindallia californiensis]SDY58702.1 aspartyl/glutamyl-tRNA(Asn/Gln) amidotransferase subunit C [Tindallia californiensis]